MGHDNEELLAGFYAAFARHDGDAMAACYAEDATFRDPVFTDLRDGEPGAMWRMLTSRATDLEVELLGCEATATSGSAHWVADYTFATGRKVHNDVRGSFVFRDGLIVDHEDTFDLWEWTRQALGLPGRLLGWSPLLQGQVRRRARGQLDTWLARHDDSAA